MRPPPPTLPTATELRDLLLHLLAGATETPEARWRQLVGEVATRSMTIDPRCNWTVAASGTKAERHAIARAIELVHSEHPYVR